jgi:hypothetical protein
MVAAAGRTATLWTGFFYDDDLQAAQTWTKDVLATGHVQQPLLVRYLTNANPPLIRYDAAVVDRTVGKLVDFRTDTNTPDPFEATQAVVLNEPVNAPALDDVDADGMPEVVFTTESGKVGYWNLNGSTSPGWPPRVEREGFPTHAGPLTANLSAGPPVVIASLGNGVLTALDERKKPFAGFPLGLSVGARGTPAIVNPLGILDDGDVPTLVAAGGDTLLYALEIRSATGSGLAHSNWTHEGGTPGRSYTIQQTFQFTGGQAAEAIVANTLKCYPNPAKRSPITFAFRLDRPAQVRFRIYDSAARQVDEFERDGSASENAIVWDPAGRVSGLYVARIEVEGQVLTAPFAIVR